MSDFASFILLVVGDKVAPNALFLAILSRSKGQRLFLGNAGLFFVFSFCRVRHYFH